MATEADRARAGPLPVLAPRAEGGDRRLAGRPDRLGGLEPGGRRAGPPLRDRRSSGSSSPWWARPSAWPWPSGPSPAGPASSGCRWPPAGCGRRHRVIGRQPAPGHGDGHLVTWPPIGRLDGSNRAPTGRATAGPAAVGRAVRSFGGLTIEALPFGPERSASEWAWWSTAGPDSHRCAVGARPQLRPPRPGRPGRPHRLVGPGPLGHGPGGIRCPPDPVGRVVPPRRRQFGAGALVASTPCSGPTPRRAVPTGRWSTSPPRSTRRHRVLLALSIHTSRSSRSIRAAGGGSAGGGGAEPGGALAAPGPRGRRHHRGRRARSGRPGPGRRCVVTRRGLRPTATPATGAPDPGGRGRSAVARGPWPSSRTGTPSAPTARGTPPTGSPNGPGSTSPPTSSARCSSRPLRRTVVADHGAGQPGRAARQVAQARTADIADGELRRRGGFLVTARHTREKESVEERDAELADGHAQYRFTGYVTVTADTRRGAGHGPGRAGAGRRPGPDRAPAALRRAGRGLRLLPCRWAGACREGARCPGCPPMWPPPGTCAPPIRWSPRPGSATRASSSGGTCWAAPSSTTRSSSTGTGVVTNPNMVVFGQIGRGKSSFVKSYLWRQAVFGRQRLGGRPQG